MGGHAVEKMGEEVTESQSLQVAMQEDGMPGRSQHSVVVVGTQPGTVVVAVGVFHS